MGWSYAKAKCLPRLRLSVQFNFGSIDVVATLKIVLKAAQICILFPISISHSSLTPNLSLRRQIPFRFLRLYASWRLPSFSISTLPLSSGFDWTWDAWEYADAKIWRRSETSKHHPPNHAYLLKLLPQREVIHTMILACMEVFGCPPRADYSGEQDVPNFFDFYETVNFGDTELKHLWTNSTKMHTLCQM